MKTFFTITFLVFALSKISFAQQATPENPRQQMSPQERDEMQIASAQHQTDRMAEFLELNEEQTEAVHVINLKYTRLRIRVMEAARAENEASLRALLSELDELRESEILLILNEEQTERYLEQKKEAEERRNEMRQRIQEGRRPQRSETPVIPVTTE